MVKDLVVCTTCHFIHAADADFALLRGLPGADEPLEFGSWQDLCRDCHGAGLDKRSPHGGDDSSCVFCHSVKPQTGHPVTVTPRGRGICEFCHGLMNEDHYAGVNPFGKPQECTGCHDPHLGKDHPALLKKGYFDPIRDKVAINPHGRRTVCFACHTETQEIGPLREKNVVVLCRRCHGSGEIAGMSHPPSVVPAGYAIPQGWPLVKGALTCLTCHIPGHTDDDGKTYLLRGGSPEERNAVCFLCHRRNQWSDRNPHREVDKEKKGCEICHAKKPVSGVDTSATVTFIADINLLCLRCHEGNPHPGGVTHTVKPTDRSEPLPAGLPLGTGGRITCATCHNPMIDRADIHNLRGAAAGTAFCRSCHSLSR